MERTLTVPGRYDRLEQICEFVADVAVEAGLDETAISRCQLAVDEACTNIIEHGYGGEDIGVIDITCVAGQDEMLIKIHDHAPPFDPTEVPQPTLDAALEDVKIGGLGVYFMRQVMDVVEFSYENGGNTLTLIKRKEK
jgi:serine/threonine-protein kinase RsbW